MAKTNKRNYTPWLPKDTEELKKALPNCTKVTEIVYVPYFTDRKFGYCTIQRKVLEYNLKGLLGSNTTPAGGDGKPVSVPAGTNAASIKTMQKIADKYSPAELDAMANGVRITPGQVRVPIISFSGQRIRWLSYTDPHGGSIKSERPHWDAMVKEAKREKVDFSTCSGDVTTGMDKKKSPYFELTHLGYAAQRDDAIERHSMMPWDDYLIAGNHDLWYKLQNGAEIVPDVCSKVKKCHYLGEHEGDISLKGRAVLKLWHGMDGSSYALSYRLQKILESLTGGEKPNILCAGHTHKALYIFERMVHAYGSGAMQRQTQWMRMKRLASHTGFWIIDAWINKAGVAKCQGRFHPFYS